MKLYYSPGACSLAPHIALHEAGLAFEAIAAPTKTHKLPDGTDYYTINPLGYVPFLTLDDGRGLHEVAVLLQYIADQAPAKNLAPISGTFERYKMQEWLNVVATEFHKGFSPLFTPGMPEEAKAMAKERLLGRLKWLDGELAGKQTLLGEQFTVADIYAFVVTSWGQYVGVDIAPFANIVAWRARVAARPATTTAMKAEGLIK
jgi:glutathione S-transferase